MQLQPETHAIQSRMATYCRTGSESMLPGVTAGRLHHYRRLIFNIVQEHLEYSFPITYEYVPTDTWNDMVEHFFSKHKCKSYQVWQIAGEFFDYAVNARFTEVYALPYLNDLLKFEWEELRIYNMEDLTYPVSNIYEDMLTQPIALNPEHVVIQLEYPVHRLTPADSIENKGVYFVLLFRERETGKVQFMEISIWYALMIEQFSQRPVSLKDLIADALPVLGSIDVDELTEHSCDFIRSLTKMGFVLGVKNN